MPHEDLARRVRAYARTNEIRFEEPLRTGIGSLTVMHGPQPGPITRAIYEPVMCVVLQGSKKIMVGDRSVTFAAGESGIVSVDLPVASCVVNATPDEPYLSLAISIDMPLLRELAAETGLLSGTETASPIATSEADDALLEAMGRLFDLLAKPAMATQVMEPLIAREIHFWMLSARNGAMLRELCRIDSHAERVSRAIALIRRDFADRLRIEDLARVAGMSLSTFHDRFKAVTGTTPLQFQKQLRLTEAKRLIASGETSVSSAAYRVGYESPTQFSREYARIHGAPPRTDRPSRAAIPA